MPPTSAPLAERVRRLAEVLAQTDLVRLRICRDEDDDVEVVRSLRPSSARPIASAHGDAPAAAPLRLDTIEADLVGIFHFSRPAPVEGDVLRADRELGFVEALGIRTPVHSLGAGRIVVIASEDGAAVEYGQPLFLLDRG